MENYPLECIIGKPSGQVINVTRKEWNALNNLSLILWDSSIKEFMFHDINIKTINKFINIIYEGDTIITGIGRKGKVKKIIKKYDGGNIDGIDYSNIHKKGETLYIIEFRTGLQGIYTENQIEKIRVSNDIILDGKIEKLGPHLKNIKNYNLTQEKKQKPYKDSSIHDLIGFPSGQIIEITYNEVGPLKRAGFIKWSGSRSGNDYIGYKFEDEDYQNILNFLYTL